MSAKDISCEIVKSIGVISTKDTYKKELNICSWQGRKPVLDLRIWKTDENGKRKALKGLTLDSKEALILKELLANIELEG